MIVLTKGYTPRVGSTIGIPSPPMVLAFDTTQVTRKANRSNPKPGDPCHPITAGGNAPLMVAFAQNQRDEVVEAIAFQPGNLTRRAGAEPSHEVFPTLLSASTDQRPHVLAAVPRRLTPTECERLQAFPDGWTAEGIEDGTVRPMADGPRYRMMGNAVTVNVIEWIGERIQQEGT